MATRGNIADDRILTVGRLTLDSERDVLKLDGEVVSLRPQSFKVLYILVENHDRLVLRENLLRTVWRDKIVTDDSLVQCLVDIRRALSAIDRSVILTLPGRGYIFQSDRLIVAGQGTGEKVSARNAWIAAGLAAMAVAATLVALFPTTNSIPAIAADRPSIAVLPFVDMTDEQDKQFLAEGFSEEILNQLAASDNLRVISRTSSFSFKGDQTDIATIAETLAVTHILEGSVRQGDDRLRITVQLISTNDESHRWSRTYDRPLGDILDVQLDIANSVAKALDTTLKLRNSYDTDANPYAHALTIQARSQLRLRVEGSNAHARRLLRRALEIDPDNVAALSMLAVAVRRSGGARGSDEYDAAWQESIAITNRALELNPDHPAAVAQRGWIELYYFKDYAAAARSVERALDLDPTHPEVIRIATNASLVFDKPDIAIRLSKYVIDRDPICLPCQRFLIMAAIVSDELVLAEDMARRLLELDPAYSPAYELLGDVLLSRGEPAAALIVLQQRHDERVGILWSKALAHYQLGDMNEFTRLRGRMIELYGESSPSFVAQLEAIAGNTDEAFAWLDKQLKQPKWARAVNYHSEGYDNLRDDPRWDEYLTEYGLSPQQLARIDFSPTLPF